MVRKAKSKAKRDVRKFFVIVLALLIIALIALFFSFAGATDVSNVSTKTSTPQSVTTQTQTVSSSSSSVASSTLADAAYIAISKAKPDTVVVPLSLWNSIQAVLGIYKAPKTVSGDFSKSVSSSHRETVIARFASLLVSAGKPKNGQVLMFNGTRYAWGYVTSGASVVDADGSVHVSGYGRKPTFPIMGSSVLHRAAGGENPERHYAGPHNASDTTGGGGTVTNVYNTTTTTTVGGTGSSATFVGTTPVTTYTGQFTLSSYTGYKAANAICTAAYTSSHMCTADEILGTIANKNISTVFSGISDAWISQGPPGFTADSNDCRGWTSANLAHLGAWWHFDAASGGIGYLTNCSTVKPIACCKVQ